MTLRTLVAHPLERRVRIISARLNSEDRAGPWAIFHGTPLSLEIQVVVERHLTQLEFGMALCNASGAEFASSVSRDVVRRQQWSPESTSSRLPCQHSSSAREAITLT